MNLNDYFDKPSVIKTPLLIDQKHSIASTLSLLENGTLQTNIAIIGVMEDSNSLYNKGCADAPDLIRSYLYTLRNNFSNLSISDFGNLKTDKGLNNTYIALQDVVEYCLENTIIPIIIGGSHDMTYPVCKALAQKKTTINATIVDATLDQISGDELHDHSFINALKRIHNIANLSVVGYQAFQSNNDDDLELYRLKDITDSMDQVEPVLRDADFASFDISAIKSADAPGCGYTSPNGLSANQLCKLAQYTGFSDRLSCFGIFGANPKISSNHQTEKIAAQAIWHFLDGLNNRYKDFPIKEIHTYIKKTIHQHDIDRGIVFYHNAHNKRWWFNAGNEDDKHIVSCSFKDYTDTQNGELPDRIMRFLTL